MSAGSRFAALPPDALQDRRLLDVDLAVLNDLGRHADLKTGWCYRAQKAIAESAGVSRRTVQRSLDRLLELCYLDRELRLEEGKGQKSNLYRVLFEPTGPRGQLDMFEDAPTQVKAVSKSRKMATPPRHGRGVNDAPPASCAGGKWRTIERSNLNAGCAAEREREADTESSEPVPTRTEPAGAALPSDATGAVPSVEADDEADAVPFLAPAGPDRADKADTDALERRVLAAAGQTVDRTSPSLRDLSAVFRWLAAGCDLDRDIVPAIAGRAARHRGRAIRTWSYFEEPVLEAHQRRLALEARMAASPTNIVPFDPRGARNGEPDRTATRRSRPDRIEDAFRRRMGLADAD